MIIINTGNGKGKSTAAFGQILRGLGHGHRVCLIQLFKGKEFYGEQNILKTLKNLDFNSFAPKHPACFKSVGRDIVKKQCATALKQVKKAVSARSPYHLVVLEEFNIALRDRFITLNELLEVLGDKYLNIDVLITGRGAPKKLIKLADLVTEMVEIKHPYSKGVKARKGIEF